MKFAVIVFLSLPMGNIEKVVIQPLLNWEGYFLKKAVLLRQGEGGTNYFGLINKITVALKVVKLKWNHLSLHI